MLLFAVLIQTQCNAYQLSPYAEIVRLPHLSVECFLPENAILAEYFLTLKDVDIAGLPI